MKTFIYKGIILRIKKCDGSKECWVIEQWYLNRFKYLGVFKKTESGVFTLTIPEKEIFRKLNGFGVLSAILEHPHLKFDTIIFKYDGNEYKTTKEQLLKHGIRRWNDFGEKIYLPIPQLEKSDPEQPTFNF